VITEIAVSFGLLVMSGLMIQSLVNLTRADFGFAMRDVWSARLALPADDYPDAAGRLQLAENLVASIRRLPGVSAVAVGSGLPMGGPEWAIGLPHEQYATERDRPRAHGMVVSNDYFDVLRVPIVEGRFFDGRDGEDGAPVAIVNQAFARRHYPQ